MVGLDGPASEMLDELWNARVISHTSLGEVASQIITRERVLRARRLTDGSIAPKAEVKSEYFSGLAPAISL